MRRKGFPGKQRDIVYLLLWKSDTQGRGGRRWSRTGKAGLAAKIVPAIGI